MQIEKTVTVPRAAPELFDYLADFSNTAEWDPGVIESHRSGDGPIGVGARFELVAEFLGRSIPLVYEITSYAPPERVVLVGEGRSFRGTDTITVTPEGPGAASVRWAVDFELKGLLRLATPLFRPAFERLSIKALESLQEAVAT